MNHSNDLQSGSHKGKQQMPMGAAFGHSYCLFCKSQNPYSLGLEFKADEKGEVSASFQGRPFLQGYEGVLHGGIISALLDAAMTHCLFHAGIKAMTCELKIRFHEVIPYNSKMTLCARIIKAASPLYCLTADLQCNGKNLANAEAKFLSKTNLND